MVGRDDRDHGGYGDHFPVTPAGRGIAALLMVTGIAFFGVITANVAAFFLERDDEAAKQDDDRLDEILRRLGGHRGAPGRRLRRLVGGPASPPRHPDRARSGRRQPLLVDTEEHGRLVLRAIGPEDTWEVWPAGCTAWEAHQRGLT